MKIIKISIVIITIGILAACKTIDVEKNMGKDLEEKNKHLTTENSQLSKAIEQMVKVEKVEYRQDIEPVVIPYKEVIVIPDGQTKNDMADKKPEEVTRASMNDAMVTPQNYIGGTQLYDYNENKQFPIITRCLAQTIIQLEPGEKTLSTPYMSDTVNWELAGDIWRKGGVDTQLVIVKPKAVGLYTNMLVITDKRLYNFILQSTKDVYMPMIRFQYPLDRAFISSMTKKATAEGFSSIEDIDKDMVSANYNITYFIFFPPRWCPTLAYDDGQKTYIVFPATVLQQELPAVFEQTNNVVNYRVNENMLIIDKLIDKVTIKLGGKSVVVEKKKTYR